jgi:hypothetical protein
MKKYLFSFLALALAIASVAFTTKDNARDSYFFEFVGTEYTEVQVEDFTKWELVDDAGSCNDLPFLACRIEVADTDTEVILGVRQLKSTAVIEASTSMSGAYVSGGAAVIDAINRN